MSTVVVGVRLTAEGGGLVNELKGVKAELANVATAEKSAAAAAIDVASTTKAMASAVDGAAAAIKSAVVAANENTQSLRQARTAGDQYAAMAAQLRAELDPMFSIQQRFDQELERAETLYRAGAISAREYASAQQLANDNLRAGTAVVFGNSNAAKQSVKAANDLADSTEEVGKSSGLARHHVQNLAFQAQDLGIQLAGAAQSSEPFKMAMMAVLQQGAQISGIMSQAGIGIGGLLAQVGSFAVAAAPFIAAGAAIAAGFGLLTSEINENSKVTVTWQDTALGAFDAIKSYMSDQLTAAFAAFGLKTSDVWAKVVDVTKWALNWMIGAATIVPRTLITAFKVLPAALGDIFYTAVNGAIGAINGLVEKAVAVINGFSTVANPILEKVGLAVPNLLAPKIAPLQNAYAGAASAAGKAFFETLKGTVTTDYIGNAADAISPFAQARARKRLEDDAKKAGKKAGKDAGKETADEFSRSFQDAMKDTGKFADQIGKALTADLKKQTAGMWDSIAEGQAKALDRITASADANAVWNEQLRDTVRLLDQVGGFGGVLGDIGSAVDALRTGDFSSLGGPVGALLKGFSSAQWTGMDDQGRIIRTMGDVFNDALDKVFGTNGTFSQTLQNAGLGVAASRIVLGDRGTGGGIGSAIGGALGNKFGEQVLSKGLTAIGGKALGSLAGPLGSVLGGVLGGVIGSAFKKTTSGGASIGLNAQGQGAVTGTAGNSADLKKTASGYGGTVVSALDQIAQALGADLGNFNVAIGKRSSGWIKVSASGNAAATTGKKVTSDIVYNGKDEGEAIMAALANAISDGAIKGVSAAVQRALNSSTDVDKAVKEALKVQQVELAIGGIGAEMEKAFKDFERQAAERVRVAQQYGFDVKKLEELNAKDRLKLQERLLKDQVGSLQDLVSELTSGSLFEGSAVDLRSKLQAQIEETRVKALAGEEGAADKLAQLLQQLNSVSRDAFGTTGTFAADRAAILDISQSVIAENKKRIEEAQKASDPALSETNTQLNEANDQLSRLTSLTGLSAEYLKQISGKLDVNGYSGLFANAGYY